MPSISIETLTKVGLTTIKLARQYKGDPKREMGWDGLLLGLLHCMTGVNKRQFKASKKKKPPRIDFANSEKKPSTVIEFACRTRGRNEHYGSQNDDEMRKLARQVKPDTRFMLLLDMSEEVPTPKAKLKATYDKVNAGPGRFHRRSVRVVYVHPDEQYSFLWQPWA